MVHVTICKSVSQKLIYKFTIIDRDEHGDPVDVGLVLKKYIEESLTNKANCRK